MRKKPNVTIFVCVDCQMIVQLLIRKKLTFLWTDSVEAWNWIKPYFCINKVIDKMILPNIFFRVGLQTTEFKLEKIAWNQNQSKCYFLRESLASRSSILVGKMPKAWYFFFWFSFKRILSCQELHCKDVTVYIVWFNVFCGYQCHWDVKAREKYTH